MLQIYPYVRDKQVFSCPNDPFGGASRHLSRRLGTPVSYFYLLSDAINSFKNIEILRQYDANHGVFYCVLHGNPCPTPLDNPKHAYEGLVLRVRVDGSVHRGWVGFRCFRLSSGGYSASRPQWQFVSDAPCPEELLGAFCGITDEAGQEVPCPCGKPHF